MLEQNSLCLESCHTTRHNMTRETIRDGEHRHGIAVVGGKTMDGETGTGEVALAICGMANGGVFQPIWICTRCNEKQHSPTSFFLPFLPASIASSSKAFHTTLYSNVPFRRPVSQILWESTFAWMKNPVDRIPGRTSKFKSAKSCNSLAKFFTSQDTFGILELQPGSVFYAH